MSFDKGRIQGFGSDGSTNKVWKCPAGHMLQPWTAQPGKCDSCGSRVSRGDVVMDCRQCNWYLCNTCHPREQDQDDSWYGIFTSFVEAATQEISEISTEFHEMAQEAETFVAEMMDSVSCVPSTKDQYGREEIHIGVNQEKPAQVLPRGFKEPTHLTRAKGKRERRQEREQRNQAAASAAASSAAASSAAASDAAGQAEPASPQALRAEADMQAELPRPKVPEDLLDFGQDDLLDLDLEADDMPSEAQAAPAAKAMDNLLDMDIIMDPIGAAPISTAPKVEVGSTSDEFLDFASAPGPTLLHTTGAGIPVLAPPAAPMVSIA